MDRSAATQIIEESFARTCATPSMGAPDREAYLAEQRDALRQCLIEPFSVLVRADDWAQKVCGREPGPHAMYALAHRDGQWLFYSTKLREFFLGYGKIGDSEGFTMLGHSSDDALAEWLG